MFLAGMGISMGCPGSEADFISMAFAGKTASNKVNRGCASNSGEISLKIPGASDSFFKDFPDHSMIFSKRGNLEHYRQVSIQSP
jgi:hypothetical protein